MKTNARLRALIRTHGKSSREVAAILGCSRHTVSAWRQSRRKMSAANLELLEIKLGVRNA